jgi:5'(3')-deoxyribonucleotidase
MDIKPTLHIDMDGVIADFESTILQKLPDLRTNKEKYPDDKAMHDAVESMCMQNKNIFRHLPLMPGAKQYITALFELFDVYFLSTPMHCVPESYTDKRLWLEHNYGQMAEKRLILTHRKDLIIGDYLIDDRTAHGADKFKGIHVHFGTAEFPGWYAVYDYLRLQAIKFA